MRKCLNILQSTYMSFGEVSADNVYRCTGNPLPSDIQNMLAAILNQEFPPAFSHVHSLMINSGFSLVDIVTELFQVASRIDFPPKVRARLNVTLAQIEYDLSRGASEKLQLATLISVFQLAREEILISQSQSQSQSQT